MSRNVRFVVVAFAASLAAGVPSCTSSAPAGVYADMRWRVRCVRMGMCSGYMDRDILGYDRENGQRISCNVLETATTRTLSFRVARSDQYALTLSNATFPRSGGSPAAGCTVSVREDNEYVGACGGSPPSETQPCQVSNVTFGQDEEGRPLIRGNIYCVGISPEAAPMIDRELTGPGNRTEDETRPMEFSLYDCNGHHPD